MYIRLRFKCSVANSVSWSNGLFVYFTHISNTFIQCRYIFALSTWTSCSKNPYTITLCYQLPFYPSYCLLLFLMFVQYFKITSLVVGTIEIRADLFSSYIFNIQTYNIKCPMIFRCIYNIRFRLSIWQIVFV